MGLIKYEAHVKYMMAATKVIMKFHCYCPQIPVYMQTPVANSLEEQIFAKQGLSKLETNYQCLFPANFYKLKSLLSQESVF